MFISHKIFSKRQQQDNLFISAIVYLLNNNDNEKFRLGIEHPNLHFSCLNFTNEEGLCSKQESTL